MDLQTKLANEGLDYGSVIQWNGRPKRARTKPPPSYWDEYVATDAWYQKELVRDIPVDEWHAAFHDTNWEDLSDVELDTEEEDGSYAESEGTDPDTRELDVSDDEIATDPGDLERSDDSAESDTTDASDDSDSEGASDEGERGGEGDDAACEARPS